MKVVSVKKMLMNVRGHHVRMRLNVSTFQESTDVPANEDIQVLNLICDN